jgi:hypothetical protein
MERKMTQEQIHYIPGTCNIGRTEIRMRNLIGWAGLFITLFLWALLAYVHAAAPWLLLLFFPSAMSATGFIQSSTHFCAGYGMRGVFNVGPKIGETNAVESPESRAKDRTKSKQILGYSVFIGACVALIASFMQ